MEKTRKTPSFWEILEARPWNDLLAENWGGYTPPLTVHLPIQPAFTPELWHVMPSLTVARRRILPGLNAADLEACRAVTDEETLAVQFALGTAPAVADFRRTKLQLAPGGVPIVRAEYFDHDGLLYEWEYFCHALPGESEQCLLWICGTVSNEKTETLNAAVRVKVNFAPENALFDYHYAPFFWDASKFLPSPDVGLNGREIQRNGQTLGKVEAGKFAVSWEEKADFSDADYGEADFQHYPPHVSLRTKNLRDVLCLQTPLTPGESATFQLAFLTQFEAVTPENQAFLRAADANTSREIARLHFGSLKPENAAKLVFSTEKWDEIWAHLPISILQLLIRFPGVSGLAPTQGGTSERHFVWVGEAFQMLVPLLQLGYFAAVREAVVSIFSLQDSGFPPKGHLTTTEGAVGTSGPKWLNSTGSALTIAADYIRYSRDHEFYEEYLPRILRAMDWICGELKATRQLNADGSRPLWFGLMPFGCATDGDIGYIVAWTDAYTFHGLEKAVLMLEAAGHARAGEFRGELETYREDIALAVKGLAREDGFIERKIAMGAPDEEHYAPFEQICGAFHLAGGNAVDVETPIFERYVAWFERNLGDNWFSGLMDRDTPYMGAGETAWQEIYLRRGEWKKAFAALQINIKYSKSSDAHQTQERFRLSDPTFCPWQPNGSGNGRILAMMIKAMFWEYRGVATLFAGVPFPILRKNGRTALQNLHTLQGRVSLEAQMQDARHCLVTLSGENLPRQLRFPRHFSVIYNGQTLAPEAIFEVPEGVREVSFVLTEREESF